jgi:D-alanyl-D-alanine carboxypeptidase
VLAGLYGRLGSEDEGDVDPAHFASGGGSRRMRPVRLVLAVAFSVLAVAACSGSGQSEPDLGALLDRVVEAGAPGAFVVLREDGQTHAEARGVAHGNRPLHGDERFRIASVTKTFVAALVLQLVEEGKLRLDDTVERWLPGLVPKGHAITVRQLLQHTSGLFDYVEEPSVLRSPDRRWTPEELIALATAHPIERMRPRRFSYSSTNYLLLGLIAEKAGGAPLATQLRRRLFAPLDLRDTSFEPGLVRGAHVHGHRPPSHNGVVTGPPEDTSAEPAWWTWAAAAMVSTPDDLQRFFAALLEGRVVKPALLRQMTTVVPAGRLDYGLGIAAFRTPCGPAWGHTGNGQGTITVAWNTADASRQLVLVVNAYPLSAELEAAVRELQDAAFCS